jgi:NAD(P)-dependent dehydrogenase (short-subunit alcohol dehydrogenase family)
MTGDGLAGRVAIVTGGTSGIGRATCLALARAGASVVVVGRSPSRVTEVVAQLRLTDRSSRSGNSDALGLALDVRSEADMAEMASRTIDRFGRLDVLVASAGIGRPGVGTRVLSHPVARLPLEEWHQVLHTNLRGVFLSNRAVLPPMVRQHQGWILNLSSALGGRYGFPFASAYCASKFGVLGLSQALAREVAQFGITVQAILPDATDTPMLGPDLMTRSFGALLAPDRVGELVVYLLTLPDDVLLADPIITRVTSTKDPRISWQSTPEVDR